MIYINNKINELDNLTDLITSYYSKPWLYKKIYFYTDSLKRHNTYSKHFSNLANNCAIREVKLFINWIVCSKYCIIENPNSELCFRLVNNDYSLLSQIALSKNTIIARVPLNSLILELHYLISIKKGFRIGSKFLLDLIKLQETLNLPLVLYCSKSLITYYEQFGFKIINRNSFNEYLLAYGL